MEDILLAPLFQSVVSYDTCNPGCNPATAEFYPRLCGIPKPKARCAATIPGLHGMFKKYLKERHKMGKILKNRYRTSPKNLTVGAVIRSF